MTIRFTKAEGAQNDFVIIDDRDGQFPVDMRKRFARTVCHRRRGVGADGLIVIERNENADFTMAFYNPDGSDGSMCGNGGRCAALYARDRGIAKSRMTFDVLGRRYRAEVLDDGVRLHFPLPEAIRLHLSLSVGKQTIAAHFIHNGAPHALILLDENPELGADLRAVNIEGLGKEIRWHELFQPLGANVNFLTPDANGVVSVRTFEKGVEAETMACGTGTLAAGMIAHILKGIAPPIALVTFGGDTLRVGFDFATPNPHDPGYFEDLYLEGPASLVFEGRMDWTG